jgi:hypothetical protein
MKKNIIILIFNALCFYSIGQVDYFELSKEIIKEKKTDIKNISGYDKNKLSILSIDSLGFGILWIYDEHENKVIKGIDILQKNKKIINAYKVDSLLILSGYFNLPDSSYAKLSTDKLPINELEYQDFWAQLNGKTYMITSFPYFYMEKPVIFKLSVDKKYLICNLYYAGMDILADIEDNVIIIYDLTKLEQNKIVEKRIFCERCYNTFLVNDSLVWGQEFTYYDKDGGEYTYSNIYKAPVNDISDTTILARNTELLDISPDGKYILGKRNLYGKDFVIIINILAKQYKYIIGRQYPYEKCFYSYEEKKFGFIFNHHLIYIEFPEKYPNDALENFKITTKKDDEIFWENNKLKQYDSFE